MSSVLDEVFYKLRATLTVNTSSLENSLSNLEEKDAKKHYLDATIPILRKRNRRRLLSVPHSSNESIATNDSLVEGTLSTPANPLVGDVTYYQGIIERCRQEDKEQKEEGARTLEKIKQLRRVYLYGLQKVSKLQNIREAPDAIMPGNFVQENRWETATAKKDLQS